MSLVGLMVLPVVNLLAIVGFARLSDWLLWSRPLMPLAQQRFLMAAYIAGWAAFVAVLVVWGP